MKKFQRDIGGLEPIFPDINQPVTKPPLEDPFDTLYTRGSDAISRNIRETLIWKTSVAVRPIVNGIADIPGLPLIGKFSEIYRPVDSR